MTTQGMDRMPWRAIAKIAVAGSVMVGSFLLASLTGIAANELRQQRREHERPPRWTDANRWDR